MDRETLPPDDAARWERYQRIVHFDPLGNSGIPVTGELTREERLRNIREYHAEVHEQFRLPDRSTWACRFCCPELFSEPAPKDTA